MTSGFWMASSKRSSAEPLSARTTCETPRTARASEAGDVPRRLKHGREHSWLARAKRGRVLCASKNNANEEGKSSVRTADETGRRRAFQRPHMCYANNIERHKRPDVPWERTRLVVAGHAIAVVSPARRSARLFLMVNGSMVNMYRKIMA